MRSENDYCDHRVATARIVSQLERKKMPVLVQCKNANKDRRFVQWLLTSSGYNTFPVVVVSWRMSRNNNNSNKKITAIQKKSPKQTASNVQRITYGKLRAFANNNSALPQTTTTSPTLWIFRDAARILSLDVNSKMFRLISSIVHNIKRKNDMFIFVAHGEDNALLRRSSGACALLILTRVIPHEPILQMNALRDCVERLPSAKYSWWRRNMNCKLVHMHDRCRTFLKQHVASDCVVKFGDTAGDWLLEIYRDIMQSPGPFFSLLPTELIEIILFRYCI